MEQRAVDAVEGDVANARLHEEAVVVLLKGRVHHKPGQQRILFLLLFKCFLVRDIVKFIGEGTTFVNPLIV